MDYGTFLANGVMPVQLPDPAQQMGKMLTLAQLARKNRMGQEEEQYKALDRRSDVMAAQALSRARQGGNPQAVFTELAQQGEAGALAARKLAKYVADQQKADLDAEDTRSKVRERDSQSDERLFNRKMKGFNDIASTADGMLRNGKADLSYLQGMAGFYGTGLPPRPQGMDDQTYLQNVVASAISAKDRMTNDTTIRGQDSTAATAANALAETMRSHKVNEGIAGGQLALARDKERYAREQGPGLDKAPAGYRWRADGSLEPIPGGPADKKQDAGMRKESSELQAEYNAIDDAIAKAKRAPGGFGTMRGMASEAGPMVESFASRMASTDENSARSAVYNAVSSVIKQRAGTAQSKQEQANILRFMPGPYADVKEIEDKFNAYKDYIKARAPAYGAEIKGGSSGASGGWGKVERVGG